MNVEQLLLDIETALPTLNWAEVPIEAQGCRAYNGIGSGWIVLTVAFPLEPQGFPPGALGYDGTATGLKSLTVVRLPRDLAERAYKLATGQA